MKVGNKELKERYLCCVTLGKSFYLADYHFSHLKSWDDSKSSINYLAIFCVFIPFLFKIRSQTQEVSMEIKTAALRRLHTSRPHLASNSSLLLVSVHFCPSECSHACVFVDHHWLSLLFADRAAQTGKPDIFTIWPFPEKV